MKTVFFVLTVNCWELKSGLEQTAQVGCDSVFGAVSFNLLYNLKQTISNLKVKF